MEQPQSPAPAPAPDDLGAPSEGQGLLASIFEAKFTWAVALGQVIVYFLAAHEAKQSWLSVIPGPVLESYGALIPDRIATEPWRLVTSLFVSVWIFYLALDILILIRVAPPIEKALGFGRFLALYVLAGAGSAVVGTLMGRTLMQYAAPEPVFALFGAYPAFVLARTWSLRRTLVEIIRIEGPWLLMLVLMNTVFLSRTTNVRLDVFRIFLDMGV